MRRAVILVWSVLAGCTGVADPVWAGVLPLSGGDGGSDASVDGGGGGSGGGSGGGTAGGIGGGIGGGSGGGAPDSGVPDAGPGDPCVAFSCPANGHCVATPSTHCECNPGFTLSAGSCAPVNPGDPATRASADVCAAWANGHAATASGNGFTKTAATCDPGVLSRAALDDALTRLNMHRWLAGLGPVTDNAADDDAAQKCALMSAWNPVGPSAHNPPTTATCYTPEGAAGAGSSNIAWGCGGADDAIDQWLVDNGNETTFGHRRWLLNPPLDPVGIGFYSGGNNYGSSACIRVFSSGGTGPHPDVVAFPPPGFSPVQITQWPWTVQGNVPQSAVVVTVTRASDSAVLPVTANTLQGNYGFSSALYLERTGWTPVAGETYHVSITGSGVTTAITYDVKPVTCM